jgi:MFS family permease
VACVFLPFAAGYYLAYLFRTINALISGPLQSEQGLEAADLGFLTSVYFLVFAAAQIPIGILLDRFGPRVVQSGLLLVAAGGAAVFAKTTGFAPLLIGRAMIGLGVAAALMASLKAIAMWFPRDRVAQLNGYMVMLGGLGAVTATAPAEALLAWMGWRGLFELLTAATLLTSIVIYVVVPERGRPARATSNAGTLKIVLQDGRFWRIAPLSAACIGSAWSLQGLWAGPWLADVQGLDRPSVVTYLLVMAIALCLGAWLLGTLASWARQRGISTEFLLASVAVIFAASEMAIVLQLPVPSILPWCIIAGAGAATVLSFAVLTDYFPLELTARANGALNLLHFGFAFASQYATGLILQQWPQREGHYPEIAYQTAFGIGIAIQIAALIWFAVPWLRTFDWPRIVSSLLEPLSVGFARGPLVVSYAGGFSEVLSRESRDW